MERRSLHRDIRPQGSPIAETTLVDFRSPGKIGPPQRIEPFFLRSNDLSDQFTTCRICIEARKGTLQVVNQLLLLITQARRKVFQRDLIQIAEIVRVGAVIH